MDDRGAKKIELVGLVLAGGTYMSVVIVTLVCILIIGTLFLGPLFPVVIIVFIAGLGMCLYAFRKLTKHPATLMSGAIVQKSAEIVSKTNANGFCSGCGQGLRAGDKFCSKCGRAFAASTSPRLT